jgi:hypothetical protein
MSDKVVVSLFGLLFAMFLGLLIYVAQPEGQPQFSMWHDPGHKVTCLILTHPEAHPPTTDIQCISDDNIKQNSDVWRQGQ